MPMSALRWESLYQFCRDASVEAVGVKIYSRDCASSDLGSRTDFAAGQHRGIRAYPAPSPTLMSPPDTLPALRVGSGRVGIIVGCCNEHNTEGDSDIISKLHRSMLVVNLAVLIEIRAFTNLQLV